MWQVAEQFSLLKLKLSLCSLKYFCESISIHFSHFCIELSPNSAGIHWYILIFLLLRHSQLVSSIYSRNPSDGSPKAGHFCTVEFGASFWFQHFWLFSTFFVLDIQILFSINSASQLFTFGKFLICVSWSLKEKLYKTSLRLDRC